MIGLYGLTLLLIWLGIGWLLLKFWRAAKSPVKEWNKTAYYTLGVVLFLLWCWPMFGKKLYYDAQVWVMCKQDGGVKVYETVGLQADEYDSYVKKNWRLPDESDLKPSDEYYYSRDRTIYRDKDPRVSRRETRIIRQNDKKVLGTYIRYGRGGGDLPGPWHGSHFTCPDPREVQFENAIFIKGE